MTGMPPLIPPPEGAGYSAFPGYSQSGYNTHDEDPWGNPPAASMSAYNMHPGTWHNSPATHTPGASFGGTSSAYTPFVGTPAASYSAPPNGQWETGAWQEFGASATEPILPGGFGASAPATPAHYTSPMPGTYGLSSPEGYGYASPGVYGLASSSGHRKSRSQKRRNSTNAAPGWDHSRSRSRHGQEDSGFQRARSLSQGPPEGATFRTVRKKPPLGPRPRDWRAGYKSSPLSFLSYGKGYSIVSEFSDDVSRTLNPLLQYIRRAPAVHMDLRFHPQDQPDPTPIFPILAQHPTSIDLIQHATNPPAPFMRIWHKELPWYCDIWPSGGPAVSVGDVVTQLHVTLSQPISKADFQTETLSQVDRTRIEDAFVDRADGDQAEIATGVKRVDFLGGNHILRGLTRKGGMWEMKLVPGYG